MIKTEPIVWNGLENLPDDYWYGEQILVCVKNESVERSISSVHWQIRSVYWFGDTGFLDDDDDPVENVIAWAEMPRMKNEK